MTFDYTKRFLHENQTFLEDYNTPPLNCSCKKRASDYCVMANAHGRKRAGYLN